METIKKTKFRLNFYHYFLISFVFVFTINLILNWNNFGEILSLFNGDINNLMAFDSAKFGKIFGILALETFALSGAFSLASKAFI